FIQQSHAGLPTLIETTHIFLSIAPPTKKKSHQRRLSNTTEGSARYSDCAVHGIFEKGSIRTGRVMILTQVTCQLSII
ncbi:hypothetical protein ACTMMZ_23690, partial [Escherichia coli]|uniref:hypothetical protein n=1 Tax=Escherichia coli TaxID=562 RepID=UPI003F893D7F